MRLFIFILLTLAATVTNAQSKGTIQGTILDKESDNQPLPFANVFIKGSQTGTTSDIDGVFIFQADPGTYTLVFSFVGYQKLEVPNVIVKADEVTTLDNVVMNATEGVSLKEVVVKSTTKKESVAALLTEQKKATEIKTAIGADELAAKGISDAAGAVTKISGVSKQEGSSNVYVRGLGDRYLNTTLNGLSLPSNDISKKNIDLNIFSSDVIENVAISKAYSSKFYGDFAAGNIDITSKNYTGEGFIEAAVNTGFNSRAISKDFVKNSGTGQFGFYGRYDHEPFAVVLSHGVDPIESPLAPLNLGIGLNAGKSFDIGEESRLNLFLTASFDSNYEYRRGETTDYTLVENKSFEQAEEYEYGTSTTIMANAGFRYDDNHSFKFSSLFVNKSSDQVSYFGIDGLGRNRDAIVNSDQGFFQMNVQFNQDLISVNQLLGQHIISEKVKLEWGVGYNRVFAYEPDRKRISIENYQLALDNDPNTNPVFFTNNEFDNQRYFQDIEDEELNGRINLSYTPSETIKFNFGYNGRTKTRDFENIRYGYRFADDDLPITDVNNLDAIFNTENLNTDGNGLFSTVAFRSVFPQFGSVNLPGNPENTYSGQLDVYAGYVNAEFNINEKWLIVPGFRVESFSQRIDYNVINLPPNDPGFRVSDENFYLPSLSVRYAINDDQNVRLAFSKTVSNPEFKEIAPFVYEGVSQRIGGNPDLLTDPSFSEVFNFDLKYEWFFGSSEIFSVGAFTKQINNPVNLVVAFDATGTQRYFRTGDKATIYGAELEVRKNFLLDEEDQPKLAAGLNVTYMHTTQDLFENIDGSIYDTSFNRSEDELQGASPLIINADINYRPVFKNYKPTANLIFSYFSDRIDALGSGQLGNVIEKGVPTLDFVWKSELKEGLQFNISAKNLLDPSIRYVRETTNGDVIVTSANGKGVTNYKRGITIGASLKYNF